MKTFRKTRQAAEDVSEAAQATTKTLLLVSAVAVTALLLAAFALVRAGAR